jgi:glutathione S-transferase
MFTFPIIITVIALMTYQALSILVSKARGQYGIKAPAVSGNENFERTYRAHLNYLENLVIFIPLLWIASLEFINNPFFILISMIWIITRALNAYLYINKDKSKENTKIIISVTSTVMLIMLAILSLIVAIPK